MRLNKFLSISFVYAGVVSSGLAAQFISFPTTGVQDTVLTTGWTFSDPGGDRPAFYDTIGSLQAVAVGAFFDDYSSFGGDYFVNHSPGSTIPLTDAILSWSFTITDFVNFSGRNDYFFSLLTPASSSLLTVNFTNFPVDDVWNVSINGNQAFTAVEAGFNYTLTVGFTAVGADASFAANIGTFTDSGTIAGAAFADVGNLRIGEAIGSELAYGDGFISVAPVPEPSSLGLVALLPVAFVLRRRRR